MKIQFFLFITLFLICFEVSAQQQVIVSNSNYTGVNGIYTLTYSEDYYKQYSQESGNSFYGEYWNGYWNWSFYVSGYWDGPLYSGESIDGDPSGVLWSDGYDYFSEIRYSAPEISSTIPSVTTTTAGSIYFFNATLGGDVSNEGASPVLSRGIKWGLAADQLDWNIDDGSIGGGSFGYSLKGLDPATTYYFSAYAVNSYGTAYGNTLSFTTNISIPDLATFDPVSVSYFSALLGGEITSQGADEVTSRGILLLTNSNDLIKDIEIGKGVGTFSQSVTDLSPNTTYYFKVYAVNRYGKAYGNTLSFTTQIAIPALATGAACAVSSFGASLGGEITSQRAALVSSRGIQWGTVSNNLINELVIGFGIGSFSQSVLGLDPNTTYFFRAYAVNQYGTAYGNTMSFKTPITIPVITTIAASPTGPNSVTIGGSINASGASHLTARGIALGTSTNPETKTNANSGIGTFSTDFSGLTVGTQYYYRAFATNSYGTAFGEEGNFILTNTPTGNALSFDGSDDYISLPQGVYFEDNTFTVEAWVYVRGYNDWSRLFDFGNGAGNNNVLLALSYSGTGEMAFGVYDDGNSTQIYSSVPFTVNQWTHIACVLDGSTGTIYMNGIKTAEEHFDHTPQNIPRLYNYIGKSNWNDAYANFSVDEFHIWRTARSESDIQSDMVFGVNPTNPDLALDLDFNQGMAGGNNSGLTSITDLTGSGIIGTLNNFALTGIGSNYVDSYARVIPTSTAATNNYSQGFNANWTTPAIGTAEKYYLDVATDNAFVSKVGGYSIKEVGNVNTFAVTGLTAGTTYYYRVCAYNASTGMGAWSNTIPETVTNASLLTVTKATESGSGSLKQCILDAAAGDYINFDVTAMGTNTIKLTSPIVISKDLTIQGAAGGIILNGNNSTKVMEIGTETDAPPLVVRLEKLTITKGKDAGNVVGGINNFSDLTMVNCLVVDNVNTGAGAVGGINSNGNLTLVNCTIAGNAGGATDEGIGGIYCGNNAIKIYNSIIYGNTGQYHSIAFTEISKSYNSLFEESLDVLETSNSVQFDQVKPDQDNQFNGNPKFVGKANNAVHPYLILGVSQCVDGGNDSYNLMDTDIRGTGYGRKLSKGNASEAGPIDIGAYEWKKGTDPNNIFTWTGTKGTEWSNGDNWDIGAMPTSVDIVTVARVANEPTVPSLSVAEGGSLTIDAGSELTTSGAIENNGTIVIKSGSSGTGSFIMGNLPTGTGFAMVERYMPNDEWHIISSPTGKQKISDFLADNLAIPFIPASGLIPDKYGMMDYDPLLNQWNGYFTASNTSELGIGKGYMVRVKNAVDNLRFQGVINASAETNVLAGWNCIGNPFTSAIKVNTAAGPGNFMNVNWAMFDDNSKALYLWNQTNNSSTGSYEVVNLADGAAYAPVGQGFFMKVKASGTVSFTTAMQTHQITAPFKETMVAYPKIRLIATNNANTVSTDIKFIDGTQKGLDPGYDAGLFNTDKSFSIYTKLVEDNGVNFQLQCLPPNRYDKMVIPVGIDSNADGEIVFTVETVQLDPTCKTILEDKLTNIFTDLSKNCYKTMVASNTSTSERFFLHTADIISGLDDQLLPGKVMAHAISNVELQILGEVGDRAEATLYDELGRVVLFKTLGGSSLNIIGLPNLKSGQYLLNINNKGTTQTMKVMVRK